MVKKELKSYEQHKLPKKDDLPAENSRVEKRPSVIKDPPQASPPTSTGPVDQERAP